MKLSKKGDIGVSEVAALILDESSYEQKRVEHARLAKEIQTLETQIHEAELKIQAELYLIEYRLAEAVKLAAFIPDLENEKEHLLREFHRLQKIGQQKQVITQQGIKDRTELDILKNQLDELVVAKRDLIDRFQHTQNEIETLRKEYVNAERQLSALPDVERRLVANEFWLHQALKADQERKILSDEKDRNLYRMAQRTAVKRELRALAACQAELSALGYDEKRHAAVRVIISQWAAGNVQS